MASRVPAGPASPLAGQRRLGRQRCPLAGVSASAHQRRAHRPSRPRRNSSHEDPPAQSHLRYDRLRRGDLPCRTRRDYGAGESPEQRRCSRCRQQVPPAGDTIPGGRLALRYVASLGPSELRQLHRSPRRASASATWLLDGRTPSPLRWAMQRGHPCWSGSPRHCLAAPATPICPGDVA